MATPFTVFRKYAGATMAVLCGLLMVSFVIADPLMQMLGGGGGPGLSSRAKDTVATWRGGAMTELQLGEAVRHRRILSEFQRQVFVLGARDAAAAGVGDLPLRVNPLELPSTYEQGVERSVVQTRIFAERALDAGFVVSDEMIVSYLRALGRDRVSNDQMRDIMGGMQVGAGRRATIAFVFDLLREAMLANLYLKSHEFTCRTILPAERWEDWLKVNDRVVLEAVPVAVEDFVDQVEDPTDAELTEFFEPYQDRSPAPDSLVEYGVALPSPLPAFATPARVTVQHVVARFEDFTERMLDEVTDDEITAYYEENKEQFIEADRALFGDAGLFGDEGDEEESADETAEDDAADDDAMAEASAEEDGQPADDEPEADDDTSADEPTADGEDAEPNDAETAEDAPGSDSSTEAAEGDAKSDAEAAVEEEEEEEETSEAAPEGGDESAEETATEQSAEADSADAEADPKVTYQPLEEVRDEVRRRVAQNKAAEGMRDLMFGLKRELDDAYAGYFDKLLDATDAEAAPPAAPAALTDLAPLAEKNALGHASVGPSSLYDLADTPFGRSTNADPTAAAAAPLWRIAFRDGDVDLYEPIITYDNANAEVFLSVITERLERVTPELDDVRDEAVAAWKRDQAADLALDAARQLASKVSDAGTPIEGFLVENPDAAAGEAFETDPMSFLTIGSFSETTGEVSLRLNQPEQLVAAGPDLMTAVFDLEAGDVGAALNHDRSVAYVLRIAARLTPRDELRSRFLTEGDRWFGTPSMMRTRFRRTYGALIDDLLGEAELEFVRTPDSFE